MTENNEFDLVKDAIAFQELQNIMKQVFGCYCPEKSLLWLTEEVGELIQAIRKEHSDDIISGELSDVIMWTINLCNILKLDYSALIRSGIEKEIDRQILVYGKLKYKEQHINDIGTENID